MKTLLTPYDPKVYYKISRKKITFLSVIPNLIKKVKSTLSLKYWRWFFRYYKKKLLMFFNFYLSKIKKEKYLEVDIDGIKCKLCFLHPFHHLFGRSLVEGKHEKFLLSLWKKQSEQVAPGGAILDIGAYNGIYGLIAGIANPSAEVIIFEPDPINFEHIQYNIKLNNLYNTRVVKTAVSDYTGNIHFKIHAGATSGCVDLNSNEIVESVTLSDWTKQNNKTPNLIKFDISGNETDILLVSEDVLGLTNKVGILLELYPKQFEENKEKEKLFWSFLHRLGFHSIYLYPRSDGRSIYYYVFKE